MRVRDIMTPRPVTVDVTSPVADAVRLMKEHGIRHLPVLEEGRLAGIISDRDLRWLLGQHLGGDSRHGADAMSDVVGEVMSGHPVTVRAGDPVLKAVDLMVDRRFGGLPVLDDTGALCGIVTYVDVLRACRALLRDA